MNVGIHPIRVLSLFSGVGGLDVGLRLAMGGERVRTICYVERDSFCQAAPHAMGRNRRCQRQTR